MSNKLNLKDVTVFCIDDIAPSKAANVLDSISDGIDFAEVKLFSSSDDPRVTDRLDKPINNLYDYSVFTINELKDSINTEFAMCVQRDGYPVNVSAWTDKFLNFDYIGAPWFWVPAYLRDKTCPTGRCVGNGGFSIRSKKVMEAAAKYDFCGRWKALREKDTTSPDKDLLNEDVFICREIADELESEGVKFAPVELAAFFSVENMMYTGQFGFHGFNTFDLNKKIGVFQGEE
jgi:hypothetical protein